MNKSSAALVLTLTVSLSAQAPTPAPSAEHQRLTAQVGTWDAVLEWVDPDGEPAKSTGVSIRKQPLGPFWIVENFQARVMGQAFKGHGATGYDPYKKKYVGSWIDSSSPTLLTFEGDYDAAGKVLTMTGVGVDPTTGKPAKHRTVTTVESADVHVFEMFVTGPDGAESRSLTITYTRRKTPIDKVRDGR